jgi:predicted Rossmann fold flavoprotein
MMIASVLMLRKNDILDRNMETKKFDVVIIGGGAAGMMTALSVRQNHPDKTVVIVDKTFELGRKLLVSGAGRGNLTNTHIQNDIEKYYHGDIALLHLVFSQFGYGDIRAFFETIGIPLYEEIKTNRGKVFPTIDNVKTVRDILVRELEIAGVTKMCDTTVTELKKKNTQWEVQTDKGVLIADDVILAGGGKTYPALGSDGSGYDLAKQCGHTINTPVPSAVPLVSKNQLSHFLQGEKMRMNVVAVIEGKPVASSIGDVLFTQYGISGPAVFDVSHDISLRINKEGKTDTKVIVSFFPDMSGDEFRLEIKKRIQLYKERPVAEILWGLLTVKTAGTVCAILKFEKEKKAGELSPVEIDSLIQVLTNTQLQIDQTRGWNEAEFTAGGVDTKEIDSQTLESKKAKGLYFAGEILDIDGQVGGFNLSWAWSSGWVAGKLQ